MSITDNSNALLSLLTAKFCFSSHVSFGVDSLQQMQQQAHLHVVVKDLYEGEGGPIRKPFAYGVLDRHMVCVTFMTVCSL